MYTVGKRQWGVVRANEMQAYLFDYDDRFFAGWRLDSAFILCTISWTISIISAVLIALSAYVLPSEGDYELIPDRHTVF
jgi:hypothetical protein